MRTSSASMLALAALALVACDRPPHDTRLPSVAPEAILAAPNSAQPPPLPTKSDVVAADATAVFGKLDAGLPDQPERNGADQERYVAAQEAAAQAPDTASADQAKKRVLEGGTSGQDAQGKPQASDLSKSEESTSMPKPGQANDHSSPAKVE